MATIDGFGPAGQAGLEVGDEIISMDGRDPRWSVGFAIELLAKDAGDAISFDLRRGGERVAEEVQPWGARTWAVFRQTGLVVAELPLAEDPDTVRRASIAFHRSFTGDPSSAPSMIPDSLVRAERVLPAIVEAGADVQPGDIILGVQIGEEIAGGDSTRLLRFARVEDAQRCFNRNSTYAGREFEAWIYRDGEVRRVSLTAKRLIL